jgi:hypothetical protein
MKPLLVNEEASPLSVIVLFKVAVNNVISEAVGVVIVGGTAGGVVKESILLEYTVSAGPVFVAYVLT